jgi:transcriptional regulator with XRE-family HTH domain
VRYSELGEQIRRLREQRGLTQEQLGERAKLHRVTVAKFEAGVLAPSLATLNHLARALGATVRVTLTTR